MTTHTIDIKNHLFDNVNVVELQNQIIQIDYILIKPLTKCNMRILSLNTFCIYIIINQIANLMIKSYIITNEAF